ncbi:hydantoinase B/oxoprolinase family protein [Nitratireductor mangrovi]|uniref:Hydantoinase B/oxoprolinase family protein n=1 Tax=Nitratireductor mangrovi TaxID=2599600 RepID=A0A5B8KZW6_9HYPH|nr:hydantoinase B/oxoprolinase family protein [Nitratireductor mangrovi]QDZ01304.1 hydantoinase B/oxoprolinase family protein [Nitratireductor mangrovi]
MDPMTFSIIRHRLFRIVDEAVITLKHVSGSAITNEGHDLMVSLYGADGSLLMGGVGFLHHLTSAAEACKAIIRRFGDRIREGDVFLLNDPYTAALHTSDIYLVAPIHFDGKLVAWSACFVHVYDIGAMNPGGFSPQSTDIFTEGFSSPGMKIVDQGEMVQDVVDTLLNMVRSPEMVMLDLRSMIACNNVARERMQALIARYGADTVEEAGAALIRQSEELFRSRLLELPDGSWQSRQYLDVQGETAAVRLTMTKKADRLIFDFSGSSKQSRHSINCTRWAALGGLFAPLFPLLCYDITWNEGIIRLVEMIAPEGTIVNCTRPAPVSVATVGAIQSVNNAACSTIGKMLASSDRYRDQATAVWHANHFAIFKFGRNQKGGQSIGILTETFAGAGGASSFADGVEIGGEVPNPISRMANVETVEASFPVRYLFRKRMPDSGGPGRWRGGTGGELAIVPHKAPDGGLHYVISGKGDRHPMSDGLAGGYPGAPNSYRWAKSGEEKAAGDDVRLPGASHAVSWGVFPLMGEDALYVRWNGGGGYGDPLDREPERVLADVAESLVSVEAARTAYGVVLSDDNEVDLAATTALRGKMKADRIAKEAML